jgi:membrane associated rhomboid family serine protease
VLIPLRDQLPTRTTPFVNYGIIAANVLAYLWELAQFNDGVSPDAFTRVFGLVPAHLFADPVRALPSVLTSMFIHGSLAHIAGNMLYLWIFGDNVEDALGHGRYLLFYLLGGLFAALAQSAAALGDPQALHVPMIGASGAISAVLAAYALLYPRSPITTLVFLFLFEVPAWVVIALFFVVNLWSAVALSSAGGVAFMAHVGGFVAGIALTRPFMSGRARMDDYARWDRWRRRQRDAW